MPFQINNRLDVKDSRNKWLEAHIVEMKPTYIKIHYKGWSSKFDEYIPTSNGETSENELLDVKFAEIGRYSQAYGEAKFTTT